MGGGEERNSLTLVLFFPLPSALAQFACGTVLEGKAEPAWEGVEGAEGRGMP